MKKDDLSGRFQKIGELGSVEEMRVEMANLQKDLEKDYADHEIVVNERDEYKTKNTSLQEANMQLYLQTINKDKQPEQSPKVQTQDLKYDDLYDEKGELK